MSSVIYVLLGAHFVGDFPMQSLMGWLPGVADQIAAWKGRDNAVLTCHVVLYALPLVLGVVAFTRGEIFLFLASNISAHFAQDYVTARLNGALARRFGMKHWFFVAIGADQLLHYVTLFVTAGWWLQ